MRLLCRDTLEEKPAHLLGDDRRIHLLTLDQARGAMWIHQRGEDRNHNRRGYAHVEVAAAFARFYQCANLFGDSLPFRVFAVFFGFLLLSFFFPHKGDKAATQLWTLK